MDLRTLRYFQVVAQSGSYSRGSELLRISQPAVSRAVHALEQELERPLFNRHGHGVTLTDAGRLLLERSQSILQQVEQTANDIKQGDDGPSGTISIAVPPTAGHFLVPALVERLGAEFPNVFLRFVGGFSGYIHEWLIRGQVDLACLHDPIPQRGFETVPVVREQVFAVRRRNLAESLEEPLSIRDLVAMPLVLPSGANASRRLLDSWAAEHGVWLQPKAEVDDHAITRALIRNAGLISLLTRGAFADDLANGEVEAVPTAPPLFWTLNLVTCLRGTQSPLVEIFAARLIEVAHALCSDGDWQAEPIVENE